jgi:hypothetical protein
MSCAYWSSRCWSVPEIHLFGETQDKILLRLVESRPFGRGMMSTI